MPDNTDCNPDLIDAGRAAFEAYARAKAGVTYDGKPIPQWCDLSDDVRQAWRAAAAAAIEHAATIAAGSLRS